MTDSSSASALSQPLSGATLPQAINRFFKKYATFTGRASRSEYWWVVVLLLAVELLLFGLGANIGARTGTTAPDGTLVFGPVGIIIFAVLLIFSLATLVPGIAVTVRRLHDGNYSGAFYLFSLIGLSIVVLILTALPSNPAGARYDAP